ncbi:MAG: M23 family metallopeptidase [Gammaproteobacteria bacterium]
MKQIKQKTIDTTHLHSLEISRRLSSYVLSAFMLALVGSAYTGYRYGYQDTEIPGEFLEVEAAIDQQHHDIIRLREQSQADLNALALRLGKMQSEMVRIEALGERLTTMANLDKGEFDFTQVPAQGGPIGQGETASWSSPDLTREIDSLTQTLDDRSRQLEVLERMVMNRNLKEQLSPSGRPIKKGWLSSHFGKRTDPFTGKRETHKGVDFAGAQGTDIQATAAGVVTWAGRRYGYGQLVEINHGKGYATRYGHCNSVLVSVGDKVEPGQVIALMGSSGRSTGPHVHYEVLKNGKQIDPDRFVQASR